MDGKTESVVIGFFSILAALMMTMTFAEGSTADYQTQLAGILDNLRQSMAEKSLISTALFFLFFLLGKKRYDRELPAGAVFAFLSLLLSLIWLAGESFMIDDTLSSIAKSSGQIVKSLIYCLGAAYFIFEMASLFCHILGRGESAEYPLKNSALQSFLLRHNTAVMALLLLAAWAAPVLISYPARLGNDAWVQFRQFWGVIGLSTHHTAAHTMLVGFFSWLGLQIGSANRGLFLYVLCQTLLYALGIGYTFTVMRKLKAPSWLAGIWFVTAAFTPYYANRVGHIFKDGIYSVAVMVLVAELICALLSPEEFAGQRRHYAITCMAAAGTDLFRNNGKYILYPTALVIALLLIAHSRKMKKNTVRRLLLLLIVSLLLPFGINRGLCAAFHIGPGSIGEAFSLPFQQTARTVRNHGDELTEEEKEAIDRVLVYDKLAESYNPMVSDPVKNLYRKTESAEERIGYFKVWFGMFFKYPKSYIAATLNQNYYLVYPFKENNTVYMSFYSTHPEHNDSVVELLGISESSKFSKEREILKYAYRLIYSSPILGVLSDTTIYVLALFAAAVLALAKRRFSLLLPALPLLLSALVVILAPIIQGHARYAFPVVYSMPVLLSYYMYLGREQGTENR
ncbi:MAG: DUF6020 family protein [Lachnospiraceae bacterium]|nr:DUF6020 family protein [Lachnospiraceae bacterium]